MLSQINLICAIHCCNATLKITRADVKAVFAQTGHEERNICVRPPRESYDRRHYWLPLAAAYGLVNAHAKFQSQSDNLTLYIGLSNLAYVPPVFYLHENESSALLMAKTVKGLLVSGERSKASLFYSLLVARIVKDPLVSGECSKDNLFYCQFNGKS